MRFYPWLCEYYNALKQLQVNLDTMQSDMKDTVKQIINQFEETGILVYMSIAPPQLAQKKL